MKLVEWACYAYVHYMLTQSQSSLKQAAAADAAAAVEEPMMEGKTQCTWAAAAGFAAAAL